MSEFNKDNLEEFAELMKKALTSEIEINEETAANIRKYNEEHKDDKPLHLSTNEQHYEIRLHLTAKQLIRLAALLLEFEQL